MFYGFILESQLQYILLLNNDYCQSRISKLVYKGLKFKIPKTKVRVPNFVGYAVMILYLATRIQR